LIIEAVEKKIYNHQPLHKIFTAEIYSDFIHLFVRSSLGVWLQLLSLLTPLASSLPLSQKVSDRLRDEDTLCTAL